MVTMVTPLSVLPEPLFSLGLPGYGIAQPAPEAANASRPVCFERCLVACPRCGSVDTARLAEFGSTACAAHFRRRAYGEPFDCFKPL